MTAYTRVGRIVAAFLAVTASASATTSESFKIDRDFLGAIPIDHTYFCLDKGDACYSTLIYGSTSSKSGGDPVAGTRIGKSYHQRCLARARASNNPVTACGAEATLYGIDGVCHQHTNRGNGSMHGKFMNPDNLTAGWWSFAAYGAYGLSYAVTCLPWSEAQCAFSW